MRRSRGARLLAAVLAMGLVVAACGDSDDGGTATDDGGTTTEPEATTTADDTGATDDTATGASSAAGGATPSTATSLDEVEALWASERQAIVDELAAGIESGEYGVGDDGVLRGPSGFEIDLNECPEDWDPAGGIVDETVRVGQTIVQSGQLAFYGDLGNGWDMYNGWVNDNGGIDGLMIEQIILDDGYVPSQTIEAVNQLLQTENVFAINTSGSPNSLAVYDRINEACVPNPFITTGHPAWGDPVNHPWSTGEQVSYPAEARLWAAWIEENLADEAPVKVAALVIDNDGGTAYEEGFAAAAEGSDVIGEFVAVRHDPAAPTVTNEMTTIFGEDPDVFLMMTAGTACPQAIQEAGRSGLTESAAALFTPSLCVGIEAVMVPAGDAADGWLAVNGGTKSGTDPQFADEPWFANVAGVVEDAGGDAGVDLIYWGARLGWNFEQTAKIAAALPGGLTRPNFMLALRSMDMSPPYLLDGISFVLDGNEDAYLTEGSQYSQFDAAEQSWVQQGEVIDLNGESGTCAWDAEAAICS